MNDFNKEELGIIACNLCVNPKTKDILRKLASMINNFSEIECQHESDGYDYFKIAEDELLMDVFKKRKYELKCKKCGKLYL